jgi:hypothetical protein
MEERREASFAPIKNADGVDSAVSARALLRARAVELLGPSGGAQELPPERLLDATRWPC